MMKKLLLLLFVLCCFFFPRNSFSYYSLPAPTGFVSDLAEVIPSTQEKELENKLQKLKKETSLEVAVVTINSLQKDTIENFANLLFNDWQIGEKNKDNGVLFLISLEEKEARIEVGYGLEPYLTDLQSKWILEKQVFPFFKNGNYSDGILAGTDKIVSAVTGKEDIPVSETPSSEEIFFPILIFIFVFIQWLVSILARSKSWWAGGILGLLISFFISLFLPVSFFFLLIILVPFGLLLDFLVSRNYKKRGRTAWWAGGNRSFWDSWNSSGGGGGFGGFGGGSSGGGGASGKW